MLRTTLLGTVVLATLAWASSDMDARLPLGSDVVVLEPAGTVVMFYATAQCDGCSNARLPTTPQEPGEDAHYPQEVTFRVTAEVERELPKHTPPLRVQAPMDPNEFLLGLRFRVRIFDGLKVRTVEAGEVRQLGMPADVAYTERVYSVPFKLGKVSERERIALDILGPSGQRVTKFYFVLR